MRVATSSLPAPLAGDQRRRAEGAAAHAPGWTLLVTGTFLTVGANLRWNVAALAWIAPVPFLLYLRARPGWPGRLALLGALQLALHLALAKIVTPPVPYLLVPGFAIPLALLIWLGYVAADALRQRAGERWGLYAFPAATALLEVARYRLTAAGTWGIGANTQIDQLPVLQLASVLGASSIGFLLAWTASLVALLLATPRPRGFTRDAALLGAAFLVVQVHGVWRLNAIEGRTVAVAGVVADLGPTPEGLPGDAAIAANTEALFARSEQAAARGARIVVWNEAATVVRKEDEAAFVERGARVARARGVDLVLGYMVPLSTRPLRFENRYAWLSERGELLERYDKHHPVPGEGSSPGTAPLRAHDRPYARAAGAICYDYDFPAMALGHARLGAGLVVVPSSDWRGIDPLHTSMARLRAIEGGFSLLRPVRWATSGAFDAYGRTRATLPFHEDNDRILLATLPVDRVPTLYAVVGDSIALLYAAVLLGSVVAALRGHDAVLDPRTPT
jgi:apolipoprotein N-acyltransferase